MGLDWVVAARPKPGHELEAQRLTNGPWDERDPDWRDRAMARLGEITFGAYETLGAPQVGVDPAATAYVRRMFHELKPPMSEVEWLDQHRGVHIVELVAPCAGIPRYSNAAAGMTELTTFRGEFLRDAVEVIGDDLLARAWASMEPPELLRFGRALLRRAELAAQAAGLDLAKIGPTDDEGEALQHALDVVREAGRWCVFWAERGHGMTADF